VTDDSSLPSLQRAIVALRQARARIEALERARNEPIAIVGMACRFPGGEDLEGFWRLLQRGGSAITEVPADRWALADYHDPRPGTPGKTVSRHGGFLEGVFEFDAVRFGISAAEAEAMDPQQRLLLEVASEAFERAGDATLVGSSTGVFVGISTHDYAQHMLRDEAPERIGAYTGTGNAFATAAGRVAYAFGLHGPCVALDTACSSALVATHLACQSLRGDECERALVAGVNVLLAPAMAVYFDRLGVLAPDGLCRAFDAHALGYARAEGCGALVLRRLSDAERDGDPIVGVIRGSAVNHNGRANGLTSPSRGAQAEVIRSAMRAAAVTSPQLGYVEAFGAGTPMGDSVELRALEDVLEARSTPLPIGSVKTNLGHAEAAAGVASLIKTVLSLQQRELVASLHFEQPNPAIAGPNPPVRVVRAGERWPEQHPRIAGVSGFGFGGTNAHVVLEAAPAPVIEPDEGPWLLVVSARSEAALEIRRGKLVEQLGARPPSSLAALSRGACAGLRHHPVRLALVCEDLAEVAMRLVASQGIHRGDASGRAASIALRSSNGSAMVSLDPALARNAAARAVLQRAAAVLDPNARAVLETRRARPEDSASRAVGLVLQLAAAVAWRAWGVTGPIEGDGDVDAIAAVLAGTMTIEEALVRASAPDPRREARPASGSRPPADLVVHLDAPGALDVLASLYVRGFDPHWEAVCGPGPRVGLPPHPFDRRPYRAPRAAPLLHAPRQPPRAQPPPELLDAPLPRRRDAIEQWLRAQLSTLLHHPPAELSAGTSLVDLGLGSLAVVEAIQAIQRELRIQVYPEELLGARSIEELAAHLARELGRHHGTDEPRDPPPALREAARAHAALMGSPSAAQLAGRSIQRARPRLPTAVFLLSAPRCGSTLLRVMLAGHPQLFAPPELHLLAHDDMAQWHRALAPRMMHLGLVQALVGTGLDDAAAIEKVRAWVADATPTASVYAELQRSLDGRRLVDKSPSYALDPSALARAESLFDGPRYVLLARHPYAAIESFTRLRMEHLLAAPGLDPHLVAEETWTRAYASLARLAHDVGPGRCHRIAYEDLVTRPEPVLRALCDFLGLAFDPATLTPYAGERMVPAGDRAIGFIGDPEFRRHSAIEPALADRWKEARLPWRLDEATVTRARALGYSTPSEAPAVQGDPEADCTLPADFSVAPAPSLQHGELLLTGATGFLGVHLLAELMTQTDRTVRCLVRARDDEAAGRRVREAMERHGLWRSEHAARIVAEVADLAAENLGLSPQRWAALASEVEAIYHNGAVVHFSHPYAALRAPNVDGTRRMLQLAAEGHAKPFFFVSSKGVFAAEAYPEGEPIVEDAPLRPIPGALGYQQSKSVAERLVAAAGARGLATAIYRPGRLGGHGVTGQVDPDDLLCRFLLGCVQLGALPDIALPLELSPVDQVAAAIVRISRSAGATGRAYHLVHPAPIELAEVRRVLDVAGLGLGLVAWDDWRTALRAQPRNALAPLLGLFADEPPRRIHEARLSTRNTAAADPSFRPPAIAEQLARNVAYMQRLGMFEDRGHSSEGDPA
jgi:thioester reductase-like protein